MIKPEKKKHFIKHLLSEIRLLDRMIAEGQFSESKPHIGAEQELCIVNQYGNVMPINLEIIDQLKHPQITTELAKFNLEINAIPRPLHSDGLSRLEAELIECMEHLRVQIPQSNFYIGGILPTLRYIDIDIENITPIKRYYELVNNILHHRGEEYELRIQGEDELLMKHDSVFIEAATTSFQIHLEVPPEQFARFYNIAQLIAAPLIAISANSPIFFRKKLWHETRIALLRQSIDIFKTQNTIREATSRVTFGNRWVQNGILDLLREDVSLHRVLMTPDDLPDSKSIYNRGEVPPLKALQQYNSTIYRWNRPVYGVHNGVPNLRIENRVLPAGPTIADQIANAAYWYGLMYGLDQDANLKFDTNDASMPFEDCKNNFLHAAQNGFKSQIKWYDGQIYTAAELSVKLLPIACAGLESLKINSIDIDRYLGILSERIQKQQNGASWLLDMYQIANEQKVAKHQILPMLVKQSLEYQKINKPVSQWNKNVNFTPMKKPLNELLIEECMDKDLFTVGPDDLLQIAADILDWQKIRFLMVEDSDGNLAGIVSSRILLKHFNAHIHHNQNLPSIIEEVMVRNPITLESNHTLSEALMVMKQYQIGCLPILQNNKLVGIVTEQTFLNVFADKVAE